MEIIPAIYILNGKAVALYKGSFEQKEVYRRSPLDFADELNSKVIPFIERRKIRSQVIILDETDPNEFIDKVSSQWSGAIPATIVYKGTESDFYERTFNYEELESVVELKLN